jgi:hypothetical protein
MKATALFKTVLVLVVCAGVSGTAMAQPPAATDVIRDVVEPASGARIRLYRAPQGEAAFDVTDPAVSIGKRVTRAGSVTTVVGGSERIVLAVSPSRVVVEGLGERVEIARGSRVAAEALRARFAASPAVRKAMALLAEVRLPLDSPMHHAIQATRMSLQAASGLPVTARPAPSLSAALMPGVHTVRATLGPGDCWTMYAIEAIGAYIEYEQCVDAEQWWDIFGMLACLAIYEVRAIGAFSWWLNCVGFGSWVG